MRPASPPNRLERPSLFIAPAVIVMLLALCLPHSLHDLGQLPVTGTQARNLSETEFVGLTNYARACWQIRAVSRRLLGYADFRLHRRQRRDGAWRGSCPSARPQNPRHVGFAHALHPADDDRARRGGSRVALHVPPDLMALSTAMLEAVGLPTVDWLGAERAVVGHHRRHLAMDPVSSSFSRLPPCNRCRASALEAARIDGGGPAGSRSGTFKLPLMMPVLDRHHAAAPDRRLQGARGHSWC